MFVTLVLVIVVVIVVVVVFDIVDDVAVAVEVVVVVDVVVHTSQVDGHRARVNTPVAPSSPQYSAMSAQFPGSTTPLQACLVAVVVVVTQLLHRIGQSS